MLNGIWQLSEVASLARASALSFPGMSQWLGHQARVIVRAGFESRRVRIWLRKLSEKS